MATRPTPKPAIMSMDSEDAKATRRVRIVATRTPSVAAATSRRPCCSRPKARRVGSPSKSMRKRPASEDSLRHWRAERAADSRPKKTMVTGTATTNARATRNDNQSSSATQASRTRGTTAAAAA